LAGQVIPGAGVEDGGERKESVRTGDGRSQEEGRIGGLLSHPVGAGVSLSTLLLTAPAAKVFRT